MYREREYEIRNEGLEGKYKDWQKKLHPDLVHTKSEVCYYFSWEPLQNAFVFVQLQHFALVAKWWWCSILCCC